MSARSTLTRALAVAALGTTFLAMAAPADAGTVPGGGYVALGDSYASGEGLAPYEADGGSCDRSERKGYPDRLEQLGPRRFDRLTSFACSGATTGQVLATQLGALSPATRTVTLTVGGNDIGFASVLGSCLYSPVPQLGLPDGRGCRAADPLVDAAIGYLGSPASTVPGARVPLASVLAAVVARAPDAEVLVSGYPQLFGPTDTDCRVSDTVPVLVSAADVAWIREETTALNTAIRASVARAQAAGTRVRYADAARTFAGHGLCDRYDPWINGLVLASTTVPTPSPASFHPTARGQCAYAAAFVLPSHRVR